MRGILDMLARRAEDASKMGGEGASGAVTKRGNRRRGVPELSLGGRIMLGMIAGRFALLSTPPPTDTSTYCWFFLAYLVYGYFSFKGRHSLP
jgi:hypothetical protein